MWIDEHGMAHEGLVPRGARDARPAIEPSHADKAVWCAPGDAQERFWMLYYDDQSMAPRMFAGHGAEEAARRAWAEASQSWNCHLMATVRYGDDPVVAHLGRLIASVRDNAPPALAVAILTAAMPGS